MAGPIRLHWAKLIAKVFGDNPVQCPRCQKDMKLKGFLLKTNLMFKEIQVLSRAPPRKEFQKYRDLPDQTTMIPYESEDSPPKSLSPISEIKDLILPPLFPKYLGEHKEILTTWIWQLCKL